MPRARQRHADCFSTRDDADFRFFCCLDFDILISTFDAMPVFTAFSFRVADAPCYFIVSLFCLFTATVHAD